MSVQSEITRITNAVSDAYGTVEDMGGTVPASATVANLSSAISTIPQPTVYDGTLTIQKNGTTVATFTANDSDDVTANITVPTIIDNVTSTSTTEALSANQGKVLNDKIDSLPEPMIFKGTLGTDGTITSLPTASSSNTGFTYKVITAGTYAGQTAKVGDTFISTGSKWELIPSGDEPSGTVTNVAATGGVGISVSGSPITTSGTLTITNTAPNVQSDWDATSGSAVILNKPTVHTNYIQSTEPSDAVDGDIWVDTSGD